MSVPKNNIFGTPILGESKRRHSWVSEPSFSEGFRNTRWRAPLRSSGRSKRQTQRSSIAACMSLRVACKGPIELSPAAYDRTTVRF
jgi:hypothetical protein